MRRYLAALAASFVAAVVMTLGARAAAPDTVPEIALRLGRGTRLLVVAPHPDDEAIGAGGLLQRVTAAGGSTRVMLMTSGDAFSEGVQTAKHIRRPTARDYRDYGNLREHETIGALQAIGIPRAHTLFLGFPDGGLCLMASTYLSAKARAFESPYTGRIEPSASEQMIRGVRYRGTDLRREIEAVLEAYRPTLLVVPNAEDEHPDHCASSIFVSEALAAVARQSALAPHVVSYLIHYDQWPKLDQPTTEPLQPPAEFPSAEGEWRMLTLTPAEASAKQRMLDTYASQILVIGRFLHAFARPNELFVEGRAASPPECWCDATHVATEAPPERYRRPSTRRR